MKELIAFACLLIGGWFILISLRAVMNGLLSRSWPVAAGIVRSCRVIKKLNSDADEVVRQELVYSYSVDDKTYRATRVRFGVPRIFSWSALPRDLLRSGESVDVYHSPSRPSISALQRGVSPFVLLALAAGGIGVWIGISLILLA